MQDFKKLEVWNDAIEFSVKIYEITKQFPDDERYGLTSQLRRASVSVSLNIAEGCGRKTDGEFIQFLHIAIGSLKECETLLILAQRIKYLDDTKFGQLNERADILGRKLNKFIQTIR